MTEWSIALGPQSAPPLTAGGETRVSAESGQFSRWGVGTVARRHGNADLWSAFQAVPALLLDGRYAVQRAIRSVGGPAQLHFHSNWPEVGVP